MMKLKISLTDLKVKSFITDVKEEKLQTVKGGAYSIVCTEFGSACPTGAWGCPTNVFRCPEG